MALDILRISTRWHVYALSLAQVMVYSLIKYAFKMLFVKDCPLCSGPGELTYWGLREMNVIFYISI